MIPKGYWKTHLHPMLGKKHTLEARKKMSQSKIGVYKREGNPNWKGGKKFDADGYVEIYQPTHPSARNGRYVLEHRLIMEECIGRLLKRSEVVHHINGIKSDNRLENLILLRGQADHNNHHTRKRNELGQFI